jgi:hypothetical protein
MTNILAYNISVTMTALKVFMAPALGVNATKSFPQSLKLQITAKWSTSKIDSLPYTQIID